jgi:hypothetical protein
MRLQQCDDHIGHYSLRFAKRRSFFTTARRMGSDWATCGHGLHIQTHLAKQPLVLSHATPDDIVFS